MASAAAQAPVAVIEEVKGKAGGFEFMDYVAPGQTIKLGPKDSIVLGYMTSCWRETITGGTIVVGQEQSSVQGGQVQREKTDCDAGRIQLSARQAGQSAATVFRGMAPTEKTTPQPQITLYGLSPVFEVKRRGTLVIERLDQQGERQELAVDAKSLMRGKFLDLAKARKTLSPGGVYAASLGASKTVFKIDSQAKAGATPIIGRLVRIQ
jgi:hypothetical protein